MKGRLPPHAPPPPPPPPPPKPPAGSKSVGHQRLDRGGARCGPGPPNHKLFKCRVSWRPEMGIGSLLSAYIPAATYFSSTCLTRVTLPAIDSSRPRDHPTWSGFLRTSRGSEQAAKEHEGAGGEGGGGIQASSLIANVTGYLGVRQEALATRRMYANKILGRFDTAVAAARRRRPVKGEEAPLPVPAKEVEVKEAEGYKLHLSPT